MHALRRISLVAAAITALCISAIIPMLAFGEDATTAPAPPVSAAILDAREEVAEANELAFESAPPAEGSQCGETFDAPGIGPTCLTPDGMLRVEQADGSSHTIHGLDAPPIAAPTYPTTSQQRVDGASASDITCVPTSERHYVLVYARPANVSSRYATIAPKLRSSAYQMSAFLDAESKSVDPLKQKRLRFRCDGGAPVVLNATLPSYSGSGVSFNDIVDQLAALGYQKWNQAGAVARYVVYVDAPSSSGAAGTGHIFRTDDRASSLNVNNKGGVYALEYRWGNSSAPHWDVLLHETGHTMGAVVDSAPNSSGAAHCNDGQDIMCYADGGPNETYSASRCALTRFDCNYNDYFNPSPAAGSYLSSHWNVAATYNGYIQHEFLGDVIPPTLPGSLTQTGASNSAVGISWSPSIDNRSVTGYTIRARPAGGAWTTVTTTTRTTASVPNLMPLQSYEVGVSARDAAGNTSDWSTLSVATNDQEDVTAPAAVTSASVRIVGTTAIFTWTDSSDDVAVRDFELRELVPTATPGVRTPRSTGTSINPTASISISPRKLGTYVFEVIARDDAANQSMPTPITLSITRDVVQPTVPRFANVYGRARNSITLSWGSSTDNMGVFRYEIQRRISGSWVTVRRTTPGHRRLTVFNLRRNTAYAFRVRATDAAGNRSAVTRTLSTRTRR